MDPSFNKTPSSKSDKVIFDTKGNEPPGYQSLPAPHYESYSFSDKTYCKVDC